MTSEYGSVITNLKIQSGLLSRYYKTLMWFLLFFLNSMRVGILMSGRQLIHPRYSDFPPGS